MTFFTVYLGLGSNLGDRHRNIGKAIELLSEQVHMEAISSTYETEPVGHDDQPHFLNAVCRVSTSLEARQILLLAKEIEAKLGREPAFRNGPRVIDIDILLYDSQVMDTPDLTIPHPRLTQRAFVLAPLAELAPDLVHPVKGKRISELLGVADVGGVKKWDTNNTPSPSP
jgi:2-amino-4-hydroxy-6-hydroxymethyldihydropteridine diphosphokinase